MITNCIALRNLYYVSALKTFIKYCDHQVRIMEAELAERQERHRRRRAAAEAAAAGVEVLVRDQQTRCGGQSDTSDTESKSCTSEVALVSTSGSVGRTAAASRRGRVSASDDEAEVRHRRQRTASASTTIGRRSPGHGGLGNDDLVCVCFINIYLSQKVDRM